jgi:hypothetical protein
MKAYIDAEAVLIKSLYRGILCPKIGKKFVLGILCQIWDRVFLLY